MLCAVVGCSDDGLPAAGAGGDTDADTSTNPSGASLSTSDGETSPTTGPETATAAGTDDATDSGEPSGSGSSSDTDGADTTGDTDEPTPGMLPDPVPPSGVAYVAHFLTNELRWYRTDGDVPSPGGVFDLGAVTHDMALDAVNDRLVVAQDVAQQVSLYALTRPVDTDTPVDDPEPLGTLDLDTAPRFVRVDPYHERLYILADDTEGGTGMMRMHTVDTTDPAAPEVLSVVALPASTSWDVDGPRRLLVLFHGATDEVFAYDVTGDEPVQIGDPIDLRVPYPETNNTAFQPRALTLDPWNARLYAARSQGANSELIVMDYPDPVPADGQSYGDVATFTLDAIEDPFDLSVEIAERPGILDAFTPLPSPMDDLVFMTASAWNGTLPSGTLVTMSGGGPLELEPGCEDHEGFGCFLREYAGGMSVGLAMTDGAACRDWTHGVVVTTLLASPENEPGAVSFFQYDADGTTTPWLADGSNLAASALPVATVCH